MKTDPVDLVKQARVMGASSKCLEILAPLSPDERQRVLFGLVVATIDIGQESARREVEGLLSKMVAEIKR